MIDQWFSPAIAPTIPFSLPPGKRGRGELSASYTGRSVPNFENTIKLYQILNLPMMNLAPT